MGLENESENLQGSTGAPNTAVSCKEWGSRAVRGVGGRMAQLVKGKYEDLESVPSAHVESW